MRSSTVAVVLGICGNLICAAGVGGQITVVEQSRSVTVKALDGEHMIAANPFEPFSETIHKFGTYTGIRTGDNTVFADAVGSQNSIVDNSGQTLHVWAEGYASFSTLGMANTPGFVGGSSDYSVTFQVASPAIFTVVEQTDHQDGYFNADFEGISEGARLHQGTTDLIPYPLFSQASSAPVTFTGTLSPGTYTFEGRCWAVDIITDGSANFTADLTVQSVPEPHVLLPLILSLFALRRRRAD